MPGPIMHMFIANEVKTRLGCKDEMLGKYLIAGSLAPDAVHAKENYDRNFKKISHLKEGIKDSVFGQKGNLELFESRVGRFIEATGKQAGERKSFYLGYLTHVLVDAEFALTLRGTIIERLCETSGKTEKDVVQDDILKNIDGMDHWIAGKFRDLIGVTDSLRGVESFGVEEFVTEGDVTISRNWVIDRIEKGEYRKDLAQLAPADIEGFAGMAVSKVAERLRGIG